MIKRILLYSLACLAFQSMSFAAEPPVSDDAQRRTLLKEGRYVELDQQMTALQQAYGRGSISDEQLFNAFRAFYYADSDMESKLDQWVAQFPRSYAALRMVAGSRCATEIILARKKHTPRHSR